MQCDVAPTRHMRRDGAGAWAAGAPLIAKSQVNIVRMDADSDATGETVLTTVEFVINIQQYRVLLAKKENLPDGSRPRLVRAQTLAVAGFTEAWSECVARHPDHQCPVPRLRPEFKMQPQHNLFSVIFVLRTEDATRLMQFWATVHMSKLQMARTPGVTASSYE